MFKKFQESDESEKFEIFEKIRKILKKIQKIQKFWKISKNSEMFQNSDQHRKQNKNSIWKTPYKIPKAKNLIIPNPLIQA